jgi:hypothetical protein
MRHPLATVALAASLLLSPARLLDSVWAFLGTLWSAPAESDVGCGWDPYGRCDAGVGMDPYGANADAGLGMDPNGANADSGLGMDPDGRLNPVPKR